MKRLIIFAAFSLVAVFMAACGPSGTTPDESGELRIMQIDEAGGMRFEPDSVVLTAGQHVRIILENQGEKNHEFMLGRNVVMTEEGAPNGFEVDFFEGIEDRVDVQLGEGAMLMIDGQTVDMGGMDMGEGEEMEMSEGEEMSMEEEGEHMDEGEHMEEGEHMDHMGFMVMNNVGSGETIIEFTVPEDRVGEWEMGCFEDDGSHYDDGMKGKLVVEN